MTPQEVELIDKYEVLFAQAGWKELVEDLTQKRAAMASALLDGTSGIDQVNFTRGLAAGYQYMIALEDWVAKAKEQAKDQELPDVE
jgi:hypothetical protein